MDLLEPFSSWSGPLRPRILWVGEAFGADEALLGKPFVGETGKEFFRMLGEAVPDLEPELHSRICDQHRFGLAWVKDREEWLAAASCAFTNVLNLRPPDNKIPSLCVSKKELPDDYDFPPSTSVGSSRYLHPQYLPHVDRLFQEIDECSPNLVVACGNTACWAILQSTNISSIRGTTTASLLRPLLKVLPTFHPASVLYQWSNRGIFISDAMKAFREGQFPELRRPSRRILINPTLEEVESFCAECLSPSRRLIAVDTETSGGLIDTLSIATSESRCCVIPFGPHRKKIGSHYEIILPIRDGKPTANYWTISEEIRVWECIFEVLEKKPLLFQNGVYDTQYLMRLAAKPNLTEDSMLAWHSLFPELPKGLGFLGSVLTDEAAWKLMRRRPADTEKRDE